MTIMTRMKALRLAAGLTQQELSVATGIYPGKITDAERDIRALNEDQWERIQLVCDDRIKMFKRDAGLTIKLGQADMLKTMSQDNAEEMGK